MNTPEKTCVWHALAIDKALETSGVDSAQGLNSSEVAQRAATHGANRLTEAPPRSPWLMLLDQFKSVLILILIGAALLAGAIGDITDAIIILMVVLFNCALGFYQEYRAERSLAALKKMLALTARVRRDGHISEIPADALVPGDMVLLEAGNRVPADGRLITAHSVEIDESALTGESHPVSKHTAPLNLAGGSADVPLAERFNMAFMNSVVTRGRAELLITATGMNTEMGRLASLLETTQEAPTPLQAQLSQLGKRLAMIAGAAVLLILVLGLLRGENLADIILTAIALAVAAIPEGLPAVVTVTLAIGMYRMSQHGAIVKRLAAVETLGCTAVICTDKTGTLTLNQMTARAFFYQGRQFSVNGEGYHPTGTILADDSAPLPDLTPLLLPAALCNDSQVNNGQLIGDPTEGALLVLAAKSGIDLSEAQRRWPRSAEIPFDATHKFMATFHYDGDQVRIFVKGAPDILLQHCTTIAKVDSVEPLSETLRQHLHQQNEDLARRGLRVLAVASRTLALAPGATPSFNPAGNLFDYLQELTFIGLIGLMDPPRPEARDAIALCKKAGIAVKMITGDQKITAAAIGQELGLNGDIITGSELEQLDAQTLALRIPHIAIFARTSPEQKVKIVRALQQDGQVVAMTGDGVNDAPALKSADIGVAMGSGTEVSKEAASLILTDDNFATIVHTVREGRAIYDNIVKFVRFQLSTNMGALLTVVSAPFFGLPIPFSPIQILWINIIMDGPPALALGVDPPRPGLMEEPPRDPKAHILTLQRLGKLLAYGATMAIGTLGILYYGLSQIETGGTGDVDSGRAHALTLAFTTFVLFQFFNVFNARAEHGSAFTQNFFSNGKLWLALAGVLIMQGLAVHWPPAQAIFHTTALSMVDWGIAVAVSSSVLWLEEARKLLVRIFRSPAI